MFIENVLIYDRAYRSICPGYRFKTNRLQETAANRIDSRLTMNTDGVWMSKSRAHASRQEVAKLKKGIGDLSDNLSILYTPTRALFRFNPTIRPQTAFCAGATCLLSVMPRFAMRSGRPALRVTLQACHPISRKKSWSIELTWAGASSFAL